jgi:hypothetical protein
MATPAETAAPSSPPNNPGGGGGRIARLPPLVHPPGYGINIPTESGPVFVTIPKDLDANVAWRRDLLERISTSDEWAQLFRKAVSAPCVEALLFWLNAFVWTFRVQYVDAKGVDRTITDGANDWPFVTWVFQDRAIRRLYEAITKPHDLVLDKYRNAGASWLIVAVFTWFFLYQRGSNFMLVSRKEALVDNPGDPDTLFWKIDYILQHLPPALVPSCKRTFLKIINAETGSTIIGQASTGDVGHGGRKTAVLFDEVALMREAREAWTGAGRTTNCRIGNSTPHGWTFHSELVHSGKVPVLAIDFWEHPEFGRGRYEYVEPATGAIKISSPWRDRECARAVSKREIAENIDRDHAGAGMMFFDTDQITRHLHGRVPPIYVGHICPMRPHHDEHSAARAPNIDAEDAVHNIDDPWRWSAWYDNPPRPYTGQTPWTLFCELFPDQETGLYRPNQNRTYVFGCDIGFGVEASLSTCTVFEAETGQQVAQFASAAYSPDEFARLMAYAGRWFGGGPGGAAFIAWESNGGQGRNFGTMLRRTLGYPWLYYFTPTDRDGAKATKRWGWHSDRNTKNELLTQLRGKMARDEVKLHCEKLLAEQRTYVFLDDGSVGPQSLVQEEPAARAVHGDRTIGCAIAAMALESVGRCPAKRRRAPVGSLAWRLQRRVDEHGDEVDPVAELEDGADSDDDGGRLT